MIYATVIFYNDTPELLKRCLESAKYAGLKVIAIDGAFQEFAFAEGEKFYSTDGCYEMAERCAMSMIRTPTTGWKDQIEKRNEYFKVVKPGNYVFVLDADEEIVKCKIKQDLTDDIYKVFLYDPVNDNLTLSPRIFKVYEGMEYRERHCSIFSGNFKVTNYLDVASAKVLTCDNGVYVRVNHLHHMRPKVRIEQSNLYKQNREEQK